MLIQLKLENFKCFRDEVYLTFLKGNTDISYNEDLSSHVRIIQDTLLNKGGIILGANGSGKSALIQPLWYLKKFLQLPFDIRRYQSNMPFMGSEKDTLIEVVIYFEGLFYQYGFSLNSTRITKEYLLKSATLNDSFELIFDKNWDIEKEDYTLTGNSAPLIQFMGEGKVNNYNSVLASYGEDIEIKSVYRFLTSSYIYEFKETELYHNCLKTSNQLLFDAEFKDFCGDLISTIDLHPLSSIIDSVDSYELDRKLSVLSYGEKIIFGILYRLYLVYTSEDYTLILDDGISSLHPKVLKKILSFLLCEGKGQIILVSNNSNLFDIDLFKVEEIWLVDKFYDGHAKLSNLYQYRKRVKEIIDHGYSLEKAYLKGHFGGIPYC